jgi:nucleoside phosphorylase
MALEDHEIWWLRAGDIAAVIDREPLTFEWDDGISWGFCFRGQPVLWDHSSDSSMGSLESVFGDAAGQKIRDAIRTLAGPGFYPAEFTPDEKALLNTAVATLRESTDWRTGHKLRQLLGDWERKRFDHVMARLRPRYFARVEGADMEFRPRIPALFKSAERDAVEHIILNAVEVLRAKYPAGSSVGDHTLDDVLAAGRYGQADRTFVENVLAITGLAKTPHDDDVDTFRKCASLREYASATSKNKDSARPWPTAPLDLLRGTLSIRQKAIHHAGTPVTQTRGRSGLDSEAAPPNPVGGNVTVNIIGSSVGAVATGHGASAAGRVGQVPMGSSPQLLTGSATQQAEGRSHLGTGDRAQQAIIGILTALPKECAAMRLMLENEVRRQAPGEGGGRDYYLGEIPSSSGPPHLVALALLPDMGNNSAAIRATQLLHHFPTVRHIIMCGIAGGVPKPGDTEHDVRLGDIVVSNRNGVVQYDLIKERPDETKEHRHPPRPPGAELLGAVRHLLTEEELARRPWEAFLSRGASLKNNSGLRPEDNVDAQGKPIDYPKDPQRTSGRPRVFHATIGAANDLLKNPKCRDYLGSAFGVKAIEMEGSGVADATWSDGAGYLVVRGICDYCDPSKGDLWQGSAAVAAAAYVRALIGSMLNETGSLAGREAHPPNPP